MASSQTMNHSTSNLRVEAYETCENLPDAVRQALAMAETLNMEQGEAWLCNLVSTVFTRPGEVFFYALYCGQELQALLPVRLDVNQNSFCIQQLGNFYTSLYQPFLSTELSVDSLAFLISKMIEAHPAVSSFRFSPMDVDGREYRVLLAATNKAGLAQFSFFCFGNWYLRIKSNWADYLAERSGQVKNTIKRKSKEFQNAGGMLELIQGGDKLEYGIQAYTKVYLSSWKVPEPYPEFTPGLIRMLARKGWLRLGLASIDGQAIAAQIWIVAHEKASIFKLAYHEEFKRYSAGTLLTAKLMEHAIDIDCVKEVDYLIGDDPYKSAWMNERRERWGIIAYNLKTLAGLIGWGRERIGRLLKPLVTKLAKVR